MDTIDALVLGAGGAGLFCAARIAERGLSVIALDHADKLGKKILVSGGGRCNFTNLHAGPKNYVSQNEHFVKSALSRFTPQDFLVYIEKYKIPYFEKKLGQLFCKDSAKLIVRMLEAECEAYGAKIHLNTRVTEVKKEELFIIQTEDKTYQTKNLIVATGGISFPKIGATNFGYKIAKQFGLKVAELDPALVGLRMSQDFQKRYSALSGYSVDSVVSSGTQSFRENILFTHQGISGPAILQISLHWHLKQKIHINLKPDLDIGEFLRKEKKAHSKKEIKNLLHPVFSEPFLIQFFEEHQFQNKSVADAKDQDLLKIGMALNHWELTPIDTMGYDRAEVTRGGVSTEELSSKTLECKQIPGLYFIGEVVDVTGWLGGFNFQWAWASAYAAAMNISTK